MTERGRCQEWLRALPLWKRVGVRGAGLTDWDVAKHVVAPELEHKGRQLTEADVVDYVAARLEKAPPVGRELPCAELGR